MGGQEYIRSVFRQLLREPSRANGEVQGAFVAAALDVMQEVESPLKEEALVRLVTLDLERRAHLSARARKCA